MFPNPVSPFADESDPNAPQFFTFPEGNVDVAGIFDYQTIEEGSGLPYFKAVGDRPVARLHLKLTDGSKGPIYSADTAQLLLLAIAFAGPEITSLLEGVERITSAYLLTILQWANCQTEAQIAAGKTSNTLTAYVNSKGWVANISGTKPPLNTPFRFKFDGWRNLSGGDFPQFQETKFDKIILLNFKIVGDMWGRPSPFNGFVEQVRFAQAFDGSRIVLDEAGVERIQPRLRLTETGARHISATRLLALVAAFCPELANHRWEIDPLKSAFGVNEIENPLPVVLALAQKGNRTAVGQYEMTQKKTQYLATESFAPVPDDLQPVVAAPEVASPVAASHRNLLLSYIDKMCAIEKGAGAFVDTTTSLALSPEGSAWCKAHLVESWTELQLPADRKLASLNEAQSEKLLAKLVANADANSGF